MIKGETPSIGAERSNDAGVAANAAGALNKPPVMQPAPIPSVLAAPRLPRGAPPGDELVLVRRRLARPPARSVRQRPRYDSGTFARFRTIPDARSGGYFETPDEVGHYTRFIIL